MASPGTFLSTVGHCGLIGWLIIGWGFQSEPLQMETMDVSVISGEEFDQMTAGSTPEPGDADPTAPVPPVIEEVPPPVPAQDDPAEIDRILASGAERARAIADPIVEKTYEIVGLLRS